MLRYLNIQKEFISNSNTDAFQNYTRILPFFKELISKKVLNPDYLLITQIVNLGTITKVEFHVRSRRYFREDEIQFSKWPDKYINLKNRYIKNNGDVSYLLKNFPTLIMFLNIIKEIFLRNRFYNPYFLLISLYTSLIFLFKHRSAFYIDMIQFLKLK